MSTNEKHLNEKDGAGVYVAELDSNSNPEVAVKGVIDEAAERRLLRKLDLRLLPITALAYFLLFLDRSNIGNARIAGLEADLGLVGYDFNIGACLFYVLYFLAEIPASLFIKRYGFQIVPYMVIGFGLVTLGSTWMKTRGEFFVVRCMLGLAEAALMPGLAYLMTRYYRRSELTVRIGTFMLGAAGLSQAFGGLLSSGLLALGSIGSVKSWRTIFLVEGIITIVIGAILVIVFPADPTITKMLTPAERELALLRITIDQPSLAAGTKEKTSWRLFKKACLNVNTCVITFMFICNNITVQGLGVFTPTILRLNYPGSSTVTIQLLSVAPALVGAIVALASCWVAMRTKKHGYFVCFAAMESVIGYGIWAGTTADAVKIRYFAIFLNTCSGFTYGPILLGWANTNASPDTVRAITGAYVNGVGCIGSIVATWSYIPTDAVTGYKIGNYLNCSTGSAVMILSIALVLYQKKENALRARGGRDYRLEQEHPEELGFHHPDFRYIH